MKQSKWLSRDLKSELKKTTNKTMFSPKNRHQGPFAEAKIWKLEMSSKDTDAPAWKT